MYSFFYSNKRNAICSIYLFFIYICICESQHVANMEISRSEWKFSPRNTRKIYFTFILTKYSLGRYLYKNSDNVSLTIQNSKIKQHREENIMFRNKFKKKKRKL